MEIKITPEMFDTICNSLRANKQSLKSQLRYATEENKKAIIESQLKEVTEALEFCQNLLP